MAIRLATTADLADLVRLNDQIQLQHAEQYPHEFKYPADAEGVSNFFADLISGDTDVVIVAFDENGLYAYLWYAIHRIPENAFRYAKSRYYIQHVLVDTAIRRLGTASALFQWVENEAKTNGVTQIALDSWSLNKHAHEFFERQGFEKEQLVFSKKLS